MFKNRSISTIRENRSNKIATNLAIDVSNVRFRLIKWIKGEEVPIFENCQKYIDTRAQGRAWFREGEEEATPKANGQNSWEKSRNRDVLDIREFQPLYTSVYRMIPRDLVLPGIWTSLRFFLSYFSSLLFDVSTPREISLLAGWKKEKKKKEKITNE